MAKAQYTPSLRCIYVKDDGTVSLYFIPPTDSTGFQYYAAYYSDNENGPFTLIANNMTTANTNCFDGIDNVQHNYYKITANYQNNQVYTSDTLASTHLTITNPGDGTVLLNWTAPSDPLLPTTSNTFEIMRKNPSDVDYQYISSVRLPSPLTYRDTTIVCDDLVKYRIMLLDMFFDPTYCRHSSNIESDNFTNLIAPHIPTLLQVSVDYNSDLINLTWQVANDLDVDAYVIFHQLNAGEPWVPVDTVYGRFNTTWTDNEHSSNQINYYRISVRDSCSNASAMTLNAQQNILLDVTSDGCSKKAHLSWSSYVNMTNGIRKYEIYFSDNGSDLQYSGEVDAETTEYYHSNLIPDHQYCFVIRAINNIGNAICYSQKFCFTFSVEESMDYAYIGAVSVQNNEYIDVHITTSGLDAEFSQLVVYKSVGNALAFNQIGTISYNGGANYYLSDYNVEVTKNIYYYKVELINECAENPIVSNVANSILLTGAGDAAHRNSLQWFNFNDFTDSILPPTYLVQRKMETDPSMVEIESSIAAEGYNTYIDDVAELYLYGSDFIYKVAANTDQNTMGEFPPSFSNEISIKQKPTTFIPNSFKGVGGSNRVFMPINSFVSTEQYIFIIYDRGGGVVFQTNDPYEGWDGTINGKEAPLGVYVYKIEYYNSEGELYSKVGTVNLIK